MYNKTIKKCGCIIYDINSREVILVKGISGIWSLPKGSKEKYESNLICAWRETYEETGIDLKYNIEKERHIRTNKSIYFIVPITNKKKYIPKIIDKCEILDIKWIKYDDLYKIQCNKDVRSLRNRYLRYLL